MTRSASSSPAAASTSRRSRGKVAAFAVAVPSWGVGTGGTRFARFPGAGEPRDIFDKLEDCAVIQQLTRATPTVSLHIPWDKARSERALKQTADALGLGFDAMNSNTFSGRARTRRSPTSSARSRHADAATRRAGGRAQSRMHRDRQDARLQGADGVDRRRLELSRPEPISPRRFERYLDAMTEIYAGAAGRLAAVHRAQDVRAGLLFDRRAGLGHQLPDRAGARADKAFCLVDLGHHAPNVNIEMIVARLIQFRQARRLPLQRFEIRRRRSRRRLDRSLPAVPGLQRAGRCRASRRRRLRPGPHARPVATTSPTRSRA